MGMRGRLSVIIALYKYNLPLMFNDAECIYRPQQLTDILVEVCNRFAIEVNTEGRR